MTSGSVTEGQRGREVALRPLTLIKTFFVSALLHIPGYGVLALGVLALAASAFPSSGAHQGTWSVLAGWSLTGLYAVAGLVGGGLAGGVAAAARTFSAFETGIRNQLQHWQPAQDSASLPALSLHQVRERYEQAIEQMYAGTLGRVRLPRFLERFVRSRFRQALVEDFLADCQRRGVTTIGFQELRQWLATRGLVLVTTPVHSQFRMWRVMIFTGLGLLAAAPLILRVVR